MDLGLKGKVAMVAGASRGLGYATAKALAAEGAKVSIASRETAAITEAARRMQQETGGSVLGVAADVQRAEAIAHWHRATVQHFGGVDLLVTNSGGPSPGSAISLDDTAWQNGFELLVLSVIRMVRAAVPSMIERKGGSIAMITSSSVKEPIANLALSNVLRASVSALVKTLANELADKGIRVNQLMPGRIDTDRVRKLDEMQSQRLGIPIEEHQRRSRATIPLGRYGQPDEFGRAAAFILSNSASFITGATLQVDGGQIRTVL